MIGEEIIKKINTVKDYGSAINFYKDNEKENLYIINGVNYRIKIIIEPKKWLSLEFFLLDHKGKNLLTYDIDTDLYPISDPKYNDFAQKTEDEIVELIDSLLQGKIKIGTVKNRPAVLIPKGNEYLLIKKGFLFTSTKFYKDIREIENASFKSLAR